MGEKSRLSFGLAAIQPKSEHTRVGPVGLLADWDICLLLVLLLADVRVLEGNSVASFTLYEIFIWAYCTPVVIGHLFADRRALSSSCAALVPSVAAYVAWLAFASVFALLARQHSDVLQQAKNIAPALPLVCFMALRLQRIETVARLANLYVFACLVACALALLQIRQGGPYVRSGLENNDYKLDYNGELLSAIALGFSETPNEFAITVLPGVILCAVKLAREIRSRIIPRVVTCWCFAGCALALFVAESRGAVVWCGLGAAFVIAPTRRSKSFWLKFVLVVSSIIVLVVYGLNQSATSDPLVENTVLGRVHLWVTALDAMASDPYSAILGDGMGYVKLKSWQTAGWEFPDSHNGWLNQALFFGMPALLFYFAIWRCFFTYADDATLVREDTHSARILLDGFRGTVLAFMGLFFFEPVTNSVLVVGQLFFFMACGMAVANMPASSRIGPVARKAYRR